jgi:hypothetical protein
MAGKKTHEQQLRTFERKDEVPRPGAPEADNVPSPVEAGPKHPEARRSEMPVSQQGMHQESRQHNKHNRPAKGA